MANLLQHVGGQIIHKLVPPIDVVGLAARPVGHLELHQVTGEVECGYGDDFRLPFQAEVGHVGVVDEGPGHLRDALDFALVSHEDFGVLQDEGIRMDDL